VQPPILEFDPDPNAVLNPSALGIPERPPVRHAVMTWFQEVVEEVAKEGELVFTAGWEGNKYDIFEIDFDDQPLLVMQAGVGAPIAAGNMEALIELGAKKIVAVGSCGGLHGSVGPGTVVVPTEAIRDEGTSYHYLRPEMPAKPGSAALEGLVNTLRKRGVIHTKATTWTTDAIFRETRAQITRRVGQGCLTVEMEASALMAVADLRGVEFAQMLYVADTLHDGEWDNQSFTIQPLHNLRKRLFGLAAEAALAIK
jgi:uridine phosphorylase